MELIPFSDLLLVLTGTKSVRSWPFISDSSSSSTAPCWMLSIQAATSSVTPHPPTWPNEKIDRHAIDPVKAATKRKWIYLYLFDVVRKDRWRAAPCRSPSGSRYSNCCQTADGRSISWPSPRKRHRPGCKSCRRKHRPRWNRKPNSADHLQQSKNQSFSAGHNVNKNTSAPIATTTTKSLLGDHLPVTWDKSVQLQSPSDFYLRVWLRVWENRKIATHEQVEQDISI